MQGGAVSLVVLSVKASILVKVMAVVLLLPIVLVDDGSFFGELSKEGAVENVYESEEVREELGKRVGALEDGMVVLEETGPGATGNLKGPSVVPHQ